MSKLDELEFIREDFLSAMHTMEKEKILLMKLMKEYMQSYAAYAQIQSQNIMMQTSDYMEWVPPNMNNSFGLDSDTEDINDNEGTMDSFHDWVKTSVIVKSGWIRKRGKIHKAFKVINDMYVHLFCFNFSLLLYTKETLV